MTEQIVDLCGQPNILSKKPENWYKWYCNKCHLRGKTTRREFECHPGATRITCDDGTGDERWLESIIQKVTSEARILVVID
jgi:hypothetical protein